MLKCISGPNLEISTWTCCDLSWTCSKWGKIWLFSEIWCWRSRSMNPQNNRGTNQGILHILAQFGGSLNRWWVIVRTRPWLMDGRTDGTDGWTHTHIHAHTHKQTQTQTQTQTDAGNTWRPNLVLASGKMCSWTMNLTRNRCAKITRLKLIHFPGAHDLNF